MGDSSDGRRLINPQEEQNGPIQPNPKENPLDPTQLNSEGASERNLDPFELLTLELGPSLFDINLPPSILTSNFWCNEGGDTLAGDTSRLSSRKRIKKEIGKFGRNIKQKLLCGFFERKGNHLQDFFTVSDHRTSSDVKRPEGLREAGLQ